MCKLSNNLDAVAFNLLLSGDVVIDEGDPLVRPLTPHTGDPGNRHLARFNGGLGAIAAQLRLFLQTNAVRLFW